jgi:hypothetical protein
MLARQRRWLPGALMYASPGEGPARLPMIATHRVGEGAAALLLRVHCRSSKIVRQRKRETGYGWITVTHGIAGRLRTPTLFATEPIASNRDLRSRSCS